MSMNFNSISVFLFAFEWKKELTVLQREKKASKTQEQAHHPPTPKEFRIKWAKKVDGN